MKYLNVPCTQCKDGIMPNGWLCHCDGGVVLRLVEVEPTEAGLKRLAKDIENE